MDSSAQMEDVMVVVEDIEKKGEEPNERSEWVLNAPEPPSLWHVFVGSVSNTISQYQGKAYGLRSQFGPKLVLSFLEAIFPVLDWGRNYTAISFRNDLLAGLTVASLCIPQGIGYATLARLDPEYGLYTSAVPPLIYAMMGSSREVAIGPVAVVSLLLSSMVQKLTDPSTDPLGYTKLVLTATLFAGLFQAAFGLLRLGFLLEFLSHAAIVGFTAGAAIVIGLQQLKGLFGFQRFTNKTDVVSVTISVRQSLDRPWNYNNLVLGCSFLIFMLACRFLSKRNRKLFWLPAISPLASVILSTLAVFVTRADKHGVQIVKHVKAGLNPSSVHHLQLNSPYIAEVAKIGLVAAVISLTESVSVGRSFASLRGYHLDGNKEMVSIGFMNIIGSFTSSYVATGSFSRTAVNVAAGCETAGSNMVMAITVVISLLCFTKLLYFTPMAILASIILSALPGLIDFNEAYRIWKLDKLDFLACAGAFFGVLFSSVETGLLVAVAISFTNIIMMSIRPGTEALGRLPETDLFCDVHQYPMAVKTTGVLIIRVKSALLCFANANFVRQRIMKWIAREEEEDQEADENEGDTKRKIQLVIIDASTEGFLVEENTSACYELVVKFVGCVSIICKSFLRRDLMNIDTSGISSLEELHKSLVSHGKQLAIANPRWEVIHKLKSANFVKTIGGRVFLTVAEAVGCKQDRV